MNLEGFFSRVKRTKPKFKLPLAALISICALPVVLTIMFYALRSNTGAMGWTDNNIAVPVRGFLGLLSSVYPFSMMEVLCTVAGVGLIYYLIMTGMVTARRRGKLKILAKRLLAVVVAALYIWSLFCWLWNSGYHAPGFAEKNGFTGDGVKLEELIAVTWMFAEKANELSSLVDRDEDGKYIADRRGMFAASTDIFHDIIDEFPDLDGRVYRPKAMMFSWLMSRTGYTGIYFALTGESNININAPGYLMPATVAHEQAHQLGVFAEDEANFIGIVACLSSGNPVFEYAGYMLGLTHLLNAVMSEDFDAWLEIYASLSADVMKDRWENHDYWLSQKSVNTGVGFLDTVLTAVTETVSDTVDTIYDGYLKAQKQELGIRSYGACVDLLVEHFAVRDL